MLSQEWEVECPLRILFVTLLRRFQALLAISKISLIPRRQSCLCTTKTLQAKYKEFESFGQNFEQNISFQVKVMEIFDVTETDPSLLVEDVLENKFTMDSSELR